MHDSSVLFVDDNVLVKLESCEFLRDHGFTVFEADNTANAFQVIDGRTVLTALITDIELGEATNGFDIARHAREVYPRLPVVFISGTASARHGQEGVHDSAFLQKPIHPQQIMEALDRMIPPKAA